MSSKPKLAMKGPTAIAVFFLCSSALLCRPALAQFPSDEEVAARFKRPGVLEVRFPRKTRGEKRWDANSGGWYWQRGLVVVRKAGIPEFPNATVEVGGVARYFITGDKVSYNKFLVMWNEYKGIPAPSREEMVAMLKKRLKAVVGSWRWNKMVSEVSDFALAKEPRIEWHTPKSFSVNCFFRSEEIVSYTEVAKKDLTVRVRFYRDAIDKPWKDNVVTTKVSETETGKVKYSAAEVRAMDTLGRKGVKPRARSTTPRPASTSGAATLARTSSVAAPWGRFQNAVAGFAIAIPGKASLKRKILGRGVQQFDLQSPWDSRLFQVVVNEVGAKRTAEELTALAKKLSDDFVRSNNARTRSQKKFPYGDMMGRELVLTRKDGGDDLVLRYRIFAAGARVWQLMLTSPSSSDSQAGFERFCGSFRRLR